MDDPVRECIESLDKKELVDFMDRVVSELYYDAENNCWDSQKECVSGSDFYAEVVSAVPIRVEEEVNIQEVQDDDD